MYLSEKIKHLREVEGELRGLNRPMTQTEVVKAMQEELNESITQAYFSQLENGKRVHLTASSRDLLSRFFKVQPGYLVSDLPDYNTDRLGTWFLASAEEWRSEPLIQEFFTSLANVEDPRHYIALFHELLDLPVGKVENIVQMIKTVENA